MQTRMVQWLRSICVLVLLGGGLYFLTGCSGIDETQNDLVYYHYDYYPDWNVYYYTTGHIYYWSVDGDWYAGERLPGRYQGTPPRTEHLLLRTPEPWVEHPGQGGDLRNGEDRN
jgi:hypothetical protein